MTRLGTSFFSPAAFHRLASDCYRCVRALPSILIVAAGLNLVAPYAEANPWDDAKASFNAGDYRSAFKFAKAAAKQKNPDAHILLGRLYYDGLGTTLDYEKAQKEYVKAAEMGNPAGWYYLGLMQKEGRTGKIDLTQAAVWFRNAAELGHAPAQNELGQLLLLDHKSQVAIVWFQKSSKSGNAEALYNLGLLYFKGQDVKTNYPKALKYFREAAGKNNVQALSQLGFMYANGLGVKQTPDETIKYFKRAAELGDIESMLKLGTIHKDGKNPLEAYKWFNLAGKMGVRRALENADDLEPLITADQRFEAEAWALKTYEKISKARR